MWRLPLASFALLLALLPAAATIIAPLVLAQVPSLRDLAGIGLVMAGIAMHKAARNIETGETRWADTSILSVC